jgi:ribonuclease E
MLIDAAHPEETRVAVLDGNQLEEFDVESGSRKQLKGNIYLAKVTRVEPSLQAAFVDYGGNRHGFLAFNEIHPDYYQIPIADRERLLAEQEEEDAEADRVEEAQQQETAPSTAPDGDSEGSLEANGESEAAPEAEAAAKPVETVGGDEIDEAAARRRSPQHAMRRYKIQEVIKRRQVLLVQVVKEERGNKGAALTTFLSLAGRYCVLMPNTGKGGGISRKIGSGQDRKRLKSIISDLEIPQGMAVIVRTAGSDRGKAEIKRDYDYLLRLWSDIRNLTLASTAPALIHAEANIINRAVRDLYTRDIEEIVVEGDDAYRSAKDLMKMLIPSHAKKVQAYKDSNVPLFSRYQIETQLESMNHPTVQLKSGGYVVLNATEALVAIDVNSGRATRGRNIEETALKTNLEAATEIARQLRLRDLAGLIVIDFIDMDHSRNQIAVERKLKEAMRRDRARIQIGRISPFGLLELSRQRLRPSLAETVTEACPHCGGTGIRRSTESSALHVLRAIEDEGQRQRAKEISVAMGTQVALYLLNHKRAHINDIETRFGLRILVTGDDSLIPPKYVIERTEPIRGEGAEAEAETRERRPEAEGAAGEDGGRRRRRRRRRGRENEGGERYGEQLGAHRADDELRPGAEGDEGSVSDEDADDDYELTEDDEEMAAEAQAGVRADDDEDRVSSPREPSQDGERRGRRRGRRGGRGRNRERERERGNGGWRPEPAGEAAEHVAAEDREAPPFGEAEGDAIPGEPGEGGPRRRRRRVRRRNRNRGDREGLPAVTDTSLPAASEAGPTLWAATEDNFERPDSVESGSSESESFEAESFEQVESEHRDEPLHEERDEQPEPAFADAEPQRPSEPDRPVEDEQPAGPPRRGWWQRLVE